MKKIIIDTNALMAIAGFKLNLFRALNVVCDFKYNIFVLEGTVKELKRIKTQQREKYKRGARLALSLLKFKKIKVIKEKGEVDDLLVRHSQKGDLILTQDTQLKKRLRKPYLTIRQKRKIIIIS